MHVIHSLDVGGAEEMVANYARHLDRTRFSPSVCALRSGGRLFDQLKREGVPAFLIGKRAGADARTLWRLVRLLRREKIDILHTHNASAHGWGLLAAVIARIPILVATEHSIHFPGRGGKIYPLLRRLFRHRFAIVISCSEQVRNAQLAPWQLPAKKHVVVHNGIDISRYEPLSKLASTTEEFQLESSRPVVGTIGSLTLHKGHIFLIDAIVKLRELGFVPQVLIVGDGPLRGELMAKVALHGLEEQVLLLGRKDNVSQILPHFDIFVLPSLREGFPITILEAMAAGLPVIATDVGGNREAIAHGETGLILPPADADALVSALRTMIENPEHAREMGKRGRRRAMATFRVERMMTATERLYEEALQLRCPGANDCDGT